MTVNTAAGAKAYIGTTLPAASPAEFEMDYFTEVGEVEDLGEFGDEANEVTFTSLANRRVRKFKGSFDAGNLEIVCGSDPADPGQADLIAAMASDLDFNFRVILNDQITLGGEGTRLYFRGKVMSKRRNVGDVENIVRQTYTVGINPEIYVVPAT